jgi:hypothetical protein
MLMMITNEIVKDKDDKVIREGIDFILSHFEEPLFPRTISTFATNNAQITVYDRQGIFEYFKAANYLDCRINAYPAHSEYKGINRQPANFLFIDMDLKDFKSSDALDRTKNNTLRKIEKVLGKDTGKPTVLWTGNGYRIYQPLEGFLLEEYDVCAEFADSWKKQKNKDLTTVFMYFAERYFTDNRNDSQHTPTIKSCMLRIPYTFNSKKCLSDNKNSEVKIVQQWNGQRPAINYLLRGFRHYLINEKLQERMKYQRRRQQQENSHPKSNSYDHATRTLTNNNSNVIYERLLQLQIDDFRKNAVDLILIPYLVLIRKLSDSAVYNIVRTWLDKCSKLRPLDQNYTDSRIKYVIRQSRQKRILPMSLQIIKQRNEKLHNLLTSNSHI